MDNLNDIRALWLTAKTDGLPSSDEMVRIVKKFRNQRLRRKLGIIFTALVCAAMMVATMFVYKSTMITTRIGEVLTIIACGVLVFTNTRSMKRFIDLKDCNNKEFIEFLEQTRRNQVYYYKRTQVLGMGLSSLGLLLYLYEMASRSEVVFIITYSIAIIWTLILWLVVRPRSFKKQSRKLDETLKKLENISKQLN
jgi:small-conductance mechanosensitive channel